MKLVRRGHHANMFMVRSAREAMDTTFMLIDEATSFEEFVRRPVNPVVWVTWW